MSIDIFWKVFSDICAVFSVLGAFPGLFPHGFTLLLPAVLCALSAAIAVWLTERGRDKLRFLAMVPVLASAFLAGGPAEALILIPPVIYSCLVILRSEVSLEYYTYRHFLRRSLMVLLLFTAAVYVFSYFETATGAALKGRKLSFDRETVLFYGVLHAVSGIVLLRRLRLAGAAVQGKSINRAQFAVIVCMTGAGIVICMAAERFLRQRISSILLSAFTAIISPVLMMYNLFTNPRSDYEEYAVETTVEATTLPAETAASMPAFSSPAEEAVQSAPQSAAPWLPVLLLGVIVILMLLMLRAFRPHASGKAGEEAVEKVTVSRPKQNENRRSNRSRIRHYYRDFLRQERKQGLKLRPDQTSADILEEVRSHTDPQATAQLRDIYLQARYDPHREPTREQVSAAKDALRRSR